MTATVSTNHSLFRSPFLSSTAGAVVHGLLYFFVLSSCSIAVVAPHQQWVDDYQVKLPPVTSIALSIWQSITDHPFLSFLVLCILVLADGSVLYVLGCSKRWPVAREIWSGVILAILAGFVTFSAFALLYPYELMRPPSNYDESYAEALREEFDRLRGEWTLVKAEQAGTTISVQPVNGEILRFEQGVPRNIFSWKMTGNVVEGSFGFSLDSLPKTIRFGRFRREGASVQFPGFGEEEDMIDAIYKIEGDRLTLCLFPWASDRSGEFVTKGTEKRLMVFERRSKPLQR